MDDDLSTTLEQEGLGDLRRQIAELTRRVALAEARLDAIHGATAPGDVYLYAVDEPEETGRGPG